MKRLFKAGEQVKLTERGAQAHNVYHESKNRVDWSTRRGVVQSYSRNGAAIIVWEGRTTTEVVPTMLLERA
jgi:hypothetical protein